MKKTLISLMFPAVACGAIGAAAGAPKTFGSSELQVNSISLPGRWSLAVAAAITDLQKQFPRKVRCYNVDIYQQNDYIMIGFSNDNSISTKEMQGSSGPCGPDLVYKLTESGKILSRDIVQ